MKINLLLTFFGLITLVSSCADDRIKLDSNHPDVLINTWVESYEEDYGIFRPTDYTEFSVSRFRQSYKFMEQNKCAYLVLSPVDAHYMESGLWEYDSEQYILRIYTSNGKLFRELKVKSVSSDLLQIE